MKQKQLGKITMSEHKPTILDLDDIFTASGSANTADLEELKTRFEEIQSNMERKGNIEPFRFMAMESTEIDTPSIVMYTVQDGTINTFLFIVESLGNIVNNDQLTLDNGEKISRYVPTADYHDQYMVEKMAKMVHNVAGSEASEVRHIGFSVIKRDVDLKEGQAIPAYYDSAVRAYRSTLRILEGKSSSPISAKYLNSRDLSLAVVNHLTPGATALNSVDEPIAADFTTTMVARAVNQNKTTRHNNVHEIALSNVTGFLDFNLRSLSEQQRDELRRKGLTQQSHYDPMLVIEDCSPIRIGDRGTVDLMTYLIGIASLSSLGSRKRWVEIINRGVDSGNLPNIGLLNMESEPLLDGKSERKELPVSNVAVSGKGKDAALTPMELVKIFCHDTCIIAMDSEIGGPNHAIEGILTRSVDDAAARLAIAKEIDDFCGGNWSNYWNPEQPIFVANPTPVFSGTFVDEDKVTKPLSRWNYLRHLQMTKASPAEMALYTDAHRPGFNPVVMDKFRRLLENTLTGCKVTGVKQRNYLDVRFINAFNKMLEDCGLRVSVEGLPDLESMMNGRQSLIDPSYIGSIDEGAVFRNQTVGGTNQGGLFFQGYDANFGF